MGISGSGHSDGVGQVGRARTPRPYMDPYVAGVGIGVVLTVALAVVGEGLGASGAFSSAVASGMSAVLPEHVAANEAWAAFAPDGPRSLLREWLVWELLGVVLGGFASAWTCGRFRAGTEHGPRISAKGRLWAAVTGGVVMGVGAKLARGCTSGQALSGGAVLSVGSWLFILGAFGAAYLAAPFLKRLWT